MAEGRADIQQVAATEDEPLNDDWDDDFGGFEGASPTLDEVSTDMAGVEASPSPWAQFSLAAAPPDVVQSQLSNQLIQKPSPAAPLDDLIPPGSAASQHTISSSSLSSEVKSSDDLPESERGQQEVNNSSSNALDSSDVSLDDDIVQENDTVRSDGIPDDDSLHPAEEAESVRPKESPILSSGNPQGMQNDTHTSKHHSQASQGDLGKLQDLRESLSLSDLEKQQLLKQKDELMAQLSNLEREVAEKEESVSAQGKVYEEMDVRHQKQLEEIRGAGHQTLAIMVEEYKELCRKAVLEQQAVGERKLEETVKKETERCQVLMKKQEEVFNSLLEDERKRGEERMKMALSKYQELQKERLTVMLEEERDRSKELLEKQAKTFEEVQLEAIKKAVASEREEGQRLIDEQKALMKTSLEEERIQCLELIKSSIEEERLKSKEAVKIALSEEREQQQDALNKTNKLAQEEMLRFSAEQRKIDNSRQQRSFAVMDLFLKGIQEQLKGLMNPEDSSTSPENEEANT
ncbi:uncharacterized protein [Apostichopus japonicus]|uniref:uncharacterized protein n=1 Tax=Stichopus japonicus TaxID=307972 RepID=UPI003AB6C693